MHRSLECACQLQCRFRSRRPPPPPPDMMRSLLVLVLAYSLPCEGLGAPPPAPVGVTNLRTEYLENPLGLDKLQPRFQWEIEGAGARGLTQVSYRIRVGTDAADGSIWDSKEVASAQNYQIKYGGAALASGGLYHWSVSVVTKAAAVADEEGQTSSSGSEPAVVTTAATSTAASAAATVSAPAFFSMGMLTKAAWGAGSFIGAPWFRDNGGCPWFRKTFTLPADDGLSAAGAALVSVASVGYHELFVNGHAASEAVLLPSVSYLPKRVLYRTYDVSSLLKPGAKNVIGVWASAGWGSYGDLHHGISVSAPLILVKMQAGKTFELISDATWKSRASNIVSTGGGPGGGDSLDDSKALPGWNTAALDDSSWASVTEHPLKDFPTLAISADAMEPTVKHSSIPAASVTMVASPTPHSGREMQRELPQAQWWGPSSLRPQPMSVAAATAPAPFCGVAGLRAGSTTARRHISAPRPMQRALLTPQANPGPCFHRGKST